MPSAAEAAGEQPRRRFGSEPRSTNALRSGLVLKGDRGTIKAALRRGLADDPARPKVLAGPRPGLARCLRRRSLVPGCVEFRSLEKFAVFSLVDVTSERLFPDHALVLERGSLFMEHSRLGLWKGVLEKSF